jgi:hypothetical protein
MTNYLYGALLLISLVLMYFANYHFVKTKRLINSGIKTKATVVKMITVNDSDGDTYKPVFEYYDKSKNLQTFESNVSSSPPSYRVNDKVQIIYNPQDKDEIKVVSYWGLHRWSIILFAISLPFLVIGAGYFLYINSSIEYFNKW